MNQPSIRTVVALAIAAFSVYLAIYYWPNIAGFIGLILQAVAPLVYGAVLAYPLNILMSFYERHMLPKSSSRVVARVRPGLSLVAALLTLVAVVAIVLRLVVPQLIDCVRLLIDELPVALQALFSWLEESNLITPAVVESVTESLGALDWQSHASSLATTVMSGVVGAVSGVVSGTATFVLAFIFALFILLNKKALARQRDLLMERYLPASTLARVRYVLGIADDCFHRFLVGQCTEAVVLGALCALGMFLLGLTLLQNGLGPVDRAVTSLAKCSFGIYLIHNPIVMCLRRIIVTPYNSIKTIILFILTLAISWAVVWAIGRNKVLARVMVNMKG